MFLFVCLLDCSLEFLIDWLIDWLAKMFMKLKLHVFWWWEISWFSLVLLYLKISTRIPKSSRVKECSLAVFSAVSRKLSSDNFQILSMSELFANSVISSIINIYVYYQAHLWVIVWYTIRCLPLSLNLYVLNPYPVFQISKYHGLKSESYSLVLRSIM